MNTIAGDKIIPIISNLSTEVANEYINNGISPDITITRLISHGDIDNEEILSRICEKANQNIYISIFNSTNNRGDIKFPMAEKENYIHYFKEGDPVYNTTLKDYKEDFDTKTASPKKTVFDKINAINNVVKMRDKLAHFAKKIESMCYDEMNIQDRCVDDFEKIANELSLTNQSVTDYAALSGGVISNKTGLDPYLFNIKIASIAKKISDRGLNINTDLTKLANSIPDPDSVLYKAPVRYISSIAKIAALSEIGISVLSRIDTLDSVLNNEPHNK